MKLNLKEGQYCEFDINTMPDGEIEQYKYGYIKSIDGNDVIIDQKGEWFQGEHFVENRRRLRDWTYDIPHKLMVVYENDENI